MLPVKLAAQTGFKNCTEKKTLNTEQLMNVLMYGETPRREVNTSRKAPTKISGEKIILYQHLQTYQLTDESREDNTNTVRTC